MRKATEEEWGVVKKRKNKNAEPVVTPRYSGPNISVSEYPHPICEIIQEHRYPGPESDWDAYDGENCVQIYDMHDAIFLRDSLDRFIVACRVNRKPR